MAGSARDLSCRSPRRL